MSRWIVKAVDGSDTSGREVNLFTISHRLKPLLRGDPALILDEHLSLCPHELLKYLSPFPADEMLDYGQQIKLLVSKLKGWLDERGDGNPSEAELDKRAPNVRNPYLSRLRAWGEQHGKLRIAQDFADWRDASGNKITFVRREAWETLLKDQEFLEYAWKEFPRERITSLMKKQLLKLFKKRSPAYGHDACRPTHCTQRELEDRAKEHLQWKQETFSKVLLQLKKEGKIKEPVAGQLYADEQKSDDEALACS